MKLILGGAYQGKLEFALKLSGSENTKIINGENCSPDDIFSAQIVDRFHEYVKRGLQEEWELRDHIARLKETNPDVIIISNELGCGIVPVDPFDRIWREETGRLATLIAEDSEEVYRVFAGIAQRIK